MLFLDTPCYSSPCQNGATCKVKKEKDGEDKEYECDCPLGFTGDDCEVLEIGKVLFIFLI